MRKFIIFLLIFLILVLSGCSPIVTNCPETKLYDFKQKVSSKDEAIHIFSDFFSQEEGYPPFNESLIIGPSKDDPALRDGSYFYSNWYGMGPGGIGGILYPDGKLVKRGYCK
jgi:hypothetical protein